MNENNPLEGTLHNILRIISPSEEDLSKRFKVIEALQAIVQNIPSLEGATVEPFGSLVSDLFTKWGDIDVSVQFGNASATTKKEKQNLLREILKELKRKGGYYRLKLISSARVPILMFHGKHNISCDLSINNLDGGIKSKLLYWISSIDGRFRNMVLLIKEWAKAHNINNSKCATLNSYSLCLLVIFHFQTLVPPILPPLKEIYPGNIIGDIKEGITEKNIQEVCSSNINRFLHNFSRSQNKTSLSELFTSFIAEFRELNSRGAKQGINTYDGQWEDIEGAVRWLPNKYPLIIEDPFEQPMNASRVVSKKQLLRISETFQKTYDVLVSPNQNPDLLMQVIRPPSTNHNGRNKNPQPKSKKKPHPQAQPVTQPGQVFAAPQVWAPPGMNPGQVLAAPQVKPGQAFGARQVRAQHVMLPGQAFGAPPHVRAPPWQAFGGPAYVWPQPWEAYGVPPHVWAQPNLQPGQAFGARQVWARPGQAFGGPPQAWVGAVMQSPLVHQFDGQPRSIMRRPAKTPRVHWD